MCEPYIVKKKIVPFKILILFKCFIILVKKIELAHPNISSCFGISETLKKVM